MSFLLGLLAKLLLQAVFELACYLTGRVVVPLLTLGYVRVEPLSGPEPRDERPRRLRRPKRSRPARRPSAGTGAIAIDAEACALLGALFWIALVAVWICVALANPGPDARAVSASSCP